MNGVHDMGGMDGFGKVEPEANEPVFHAEWERRVMALSRAMQATGEWNIDIGRYWIELLPPATYLSSTYYKRWFLRLENLCIARGLVTRSELDAGQSAGTGRPLAGKVLTADLAASRLKRGDFACLPKGPHLFDIGTKVRARNIHPASHTRLPRFARGRIGTVERIQGCHIYPDRLVESGVKEGEWLYTVTFMGRDLWGPDADPTVKVSIEAFEPYLEAAP
jgi:nitrile hydratase